IPQAAAKRASVPQGKIEAEKKADAGKESAGDQYKTKQGDTLGKIAGQFKHEGISLDQMLVALQRANPNAFVGNNMNRLKTGQILSVPSAEAAGGVSAVEARKIVVAQSADFTSYRTKLAARVSAADAQKSEEAKQSTGGKITAKVEEPATAANEAKDKLKLSNSGAAAASGANKAGAVPAGAEDKIAKDKAVAEANARVQELEKNISELQKLLEVKNKDLADKQKQADAPKADPAAKVAIAPGADRSAPPVAPATPTASANVAKSEPLVTPGEIVTPESEPTASDAPQTMAAAPAKEEAAPVAPPPAQAKPAAKKKAVPPPAPVPEPSFVDELLEDPTMLGLGAGLLALLGGLGIYTSRRRKQAAAFQDSTMLNESNLKANSLFASTGGQSVDTNNSVFNSNFSPSASQLDTNEVDPVAEADVYIAYGRDAQAEEILKEALRTQPERNAVRVKLLEIYAHRKDTRAFEAMASELYSLTKGKGEDWEQVANLGASIDPKNPMYAGGKPSHNKAAAGDKLTAATEHLDELDLAALLNTTRGAEQPELEHAGADDKSDQQKKTSETFSGRQPVTEEKTASPKDKEENFADFLNEPVEPAKAEVPKSETPEPEAPATETPAALDFDFVLSGFGINKQELPASAPEENAAEDKDANALDFDFQMDDKKTVNLDDSDFSIDQPNEQKADEDVPSLELDMPSLPDTMVSTPAAPALDLSAISLDLNALGTDTAVVPDDADSEISNAAEMATKLDLALAYQEIGDKEGARELLDEVIKGGSEEQVAKAKAMLQKLG
ncbi:MAG: FimV/HubP family polar landmark protein, partial [Burkholderiaceae bacterium]